MYGRSRYIKQSFQKRGDYLIVCLMISKGMKQIILKVCFLLCIVFVFLYYVCVSGVSKREWLKQQKGQLNSYKRGGSLRSRPRVSYTEEEEPKDEDYLCELLLLLPFYLTQSLSVSLFNDWCKCSNITEFQQYNCSLTPSFCEFMFSFLLLTSPL